MTLRLALASVWLPAFVKRRKLASLLDRTAAAFGVSPPDIADQTLAERLRTFAAFSNEQAEHACAAGGEDVARRLRAAASELGGELREQLGVRSPRDGMRAARLLYGTLGIDFRGRPDGAITIPRCYFADWYTPRVCALMSALDEGVLAGLTGTKGEGRLEFEGRITEGCPRCTATFHFEDRDA